jgi:hypothetical protein
MSQLVNIDASRRSHSYKNLGSFWTSIFRDRDKVRILMDMVFRSRVIPDFQALVGNISGDSNRGSAVSFVNVRFNKSSVFQSGMFVFDDPDRDTQYGTSFDAEIVYDAFRIRYFVLPLQAIVPIKIQAKGRTLVLGIDFFIQSGNWIFFRDDPRELFPDGNYLVTKGWNQDYRSCLSYLIKTITAGNDDLVVQWLRNLQTPKYFKLALAAASFLSVIRKGGTLVSATRTADGIAVYTFAEESVRVYYAHEALIPGQVYAPGTIVGDVIQIYQATEKKTDWWRQIDWRGGLILDPILPGFRNLPLRDQTTVAYVAGQEVGSAGGSKVHARLVLSDHFEHEDKYWQQVAINETTLDMYLNRVLHLEEETDGGDPTLPDTFAKLKAATTEANELNARLGLAPEQPDFRALPNSIEVNALDTFFEALLQHTACVVLIDMSRLPSPTSTMAFLCREMPAGSTTIIFGYLSSTPTDPVIWGETVVVEDSVKVQPIAPQVFGETVTLDDYVQEYVDLTPLFPEL